MSDRSEFEALVREHHPYILRLCGYMLGNPADAEEVAQEVFLKAWRSRDSFRGESSFQTWLHRIAVNKCKDFQRYSNRRRALSWDALIEEGGEGLGEALNSAPDSSGALENKDLAQRVLDQLPPAYRTALVLREVEGLTYEEIADRMGVSLDSVKARLRRARAVIVQRLRHLGAAKDV